MRRYRYRIIALVTIALLLGLPSDGHSATRSVVLSVWGVAAAPWRSLPTPCGGVLVVARSEYNTAGWHGYREGCTVWLDPALRTRAWVCSILMHELGHVHGAPHSPNPRSVMHPFQRRPDPRCL